VSLRSGYSLSASIAFSPTGHGGDEAEALLDLWATLCDQDAAQDAIAHVAEAFTRRTGKAPR
jgi:hypothetical protein